MRGSPHFLEGEPLSLRTGIPLNFELVAGERPSDPTAYLLEDVGPQASWRVSRPPSGQRTSRVSVFGESPRPKVAGRLYE